MKITAAAAAIALSLSEDGEPAQVFDTDLKAPRPLTAGEVREGTRYAARMDKRAVYAEAQARRFARDAADIARRARQAEAGVRMSTARQGMAKIAASL